MDMAYVHLNRWLALDFVWGETDCMLVLADYLIDLGYPDIGAKWRGKYDSSTSCHRLTNYLKDPVAPLQEGCSLIGLDRTDNPQRGDIGVIRIQDADMRVKAVGALFAGQNWAVKGELRRVLIGPAIDVLAAWRVTPCVG